MIGALISELGQVAKQMIQRNMNIAPTIEIRAGYKFNIFTTKDIILEPLEY
jgi:type IV secretion system protein VirB10